MDGVTGDHVQSTTPARRRCRMGANDRPTSIGSENHRMPRKQATQPRERYYHLSPTEHAASIQECGIRADRDGRIFLFTDMLVANVIAKSQVHTRRYVVFEIAPDGVCGPLEPDEVAEFSHPFQRILRQQRVAPEHLRLVGTYDTVVDYPVEWDYRLAERQGESREYVDEVFAAHRECRAAIRAGVPEEDAVSRLNDRLRRASKKPKAVS